MRLAERRASTVRAPYIIAEIGVNHDGDPARALELTDAAAGAGADAVKLQLFETDRLMSGGGRLAAYQREAGERDPFAMLRRLELPVSDMAPVVDRAHALGLDVIVTVFSAELVDDAETLAWDAYKTASPDIVNRPLIDRLIRTARPLLVSTGAATMDEVRRTVEHIRERSAHGDLTVLQCVSNYPTADDDAALDGIAALRDELAGADVAIGYSDHTASIETGAIAVGAGAAALEKHLTWSNAAPGPDHAASLEPAAFKTYAALARRAARMFGDHSGKRVLPVERDVREVSRQSLVLLRPLKRGEALRRDDLTTKRPGTGMDPWRIDAVVGRRAARDLVPDAPLLEGDLQ